MLVQRLKRRIQSVRARLGQPTTEISIWPSAVAGQHVFKPSAEVVQVDTAQLNAGTNPVNVVVPSAKTTNIRMIFPGPGVFIGRWLKANLYMRLHDPQLKGDTVAWLPVVSNTGVWGSTTDVLNVPFTTRFSVFPRQPQTPAAYGNGVGASRLTPPALNYFWNMKDERSGRMYSDRELSHMMLLPNTWQRSGDDQVADPLGGAPVGYPVADGDLFDLKCPWVFERDGQATFFFRPITDLYQFASSLSGTDPIVGLPFDDRENGVRDQSMKVQVEMHGLRFETMQDAVHAGALTQIWDDDSNGDPLPEGTARMARKGG